MRTDAMISAARVVLLLFLLLVPMVAALSAQPAPDDSLAGIWVSENRVPPALQGELTLRRNGRRWRATIAGAESTFEGRSDAIRFAFSENRGRFRGALAADGRTIAG